MAINVWKNEDDKRFEVQVDDELAGFIDYSLEGDTFVLPHTEVFDKFGGAGIGSTLATGALDIISAEGAQVLPYCPFVAKVIGDHSKYLGLVPEAARARFALATPTAVDS